MKRNSDRYKSNRVGKSIAREDRKRSLVEVEKKMERKTMNNNELVLYGNPTPIDL